VNTLRQSLNYGVCGKYWLILIIVVMVSGCASHHQSIKTESTTLYPHGALAEEAEQNTKTSVHLSGNDHNRKDGEVLQTTTVTTETQTEHPGVLGSMFHAIGYVISLPFVMVGGLIKIIFGG
jgi:hypothetical protein